MSTVADRLLTTYLRYGVPSDIAGALAAQELSVTTFRATSIDNLSQRYSISPDIAKWVKSCLARSPIDAEVLQMLLENSNFVCCCCKGTKSDAYIVHHIVPYEDTQDNTYDNLAVLCPNDHDLAHRPPGLTNTLTREQIRRSKQGWETEVRVNNLAVSIQDRERLIRGVPRYRQLELELADLRRALADKDKLVTRSEVFFDVEKRKLEDRVEAIGEEKRRIETQLQQLLGRFASIDLTKASQQVMTALDEVTRGNIGQALAILDEHELDLELGRVESLQKEVEESLLRNIEGRVLKAELLAITGDFVEACRVAGTALSICEDLAERDFSAYGSRLGEVFEEVGTIYFNAEVTDGAAACFQNGLAVCSTLWEGGNYGVLPLMALLQQNMGACFYRSGDFASARDYLEEAEGLYAGIEDAWSKVAGVNSVLQTRRAQTLTNLGATYTALRDDKKAQEYLLAARRLIESNGGAEGDVSEVRIRNLAALAQSQYASGDLPAAKTTSLEVLSLLRTRAEGNYWLSVTLIEEVLNLCRVCLLLGENDEVERFAAEASERVRNLGVETRDGLEIHLATATLYKAIAGVAGGRDQGVGDEAIQLALQAKALAEKHPDSKEAQKLVDAANLLLSRRPEDGSEES